jgi:Type IV pilin-like G and H, putative
MSTNIAKKSKISSFSLSNLLLRTLIYSVFLAGIISSFYDFKLNTIVKSNVMSNSVKSSESKQSNVATEVQNYIASINERQQAYYAENNKFSDSIEKLGVRTQEQINNTYNYKILSSMGPVQTSYNKREPAQFESAIAIARPESSGGQSYTGVVFALKESSSNQLITISGICKSEGDGVILIPPTLDGKKIHCPPGTTLLR